MLVFVYVHVCLCISACVYLVFFFMYLCVCVDGYLCCCGYLSAYVFFLRDFCLSFCSCESCFCVFTFLYVHNCVCFQASQVEVTDLQLQKEELCSQIRDLRIPLHLTSDSIPELKKKLRELETRDKERSEEISQMTARIKQQEQVQEPENNFSTK